MFADDLQHFSGIESVADCANFRKQLDSPVSRFDSVALNFNAGECQSVCFTGSRTILLTTRT